MKTIVLQEPGKLIFSETSAPAAPAPGEALVRVHRVGICGTDWHAYHGRQPFFSYPRIIGHELGVEVMAVNGPGDLAPGERCAVEPYLNCGRCIACRRGRGNCCSNLKVMGVHVDGGMREQFVVPLNKLHRSRKLSYEQLALVETLGIGCHAVQRAGPERGETALVIGAGPIGLSLIPFLKEAGAKVIVLDISAARLDFCRATMNVAVVQGGPETVAAANEGDHPTVVFDATGNRQSMLAAFDFLAPTGRLVFVGLFQGDAAFNDPQFHRRELTLLATRNSLPEDFRGIIQRMEDGRIDTRPWITHRASCDQLLAALPGWLSPDARVIKAMVEF